MKEKFAKYFINEMEMLQYEESRTNFYSWEIEHPYLSELKRLIIPSYRKLAKDYDSYIGGYYQIAHNVIGTEHVVLLNANQLEDSVIIVEQDLNRKYRRFYVYRNGEFVLISRAVNIYKYNS